LRQETGEAFARRRQKYAVQVLVAHGGVNVGRHSLAPSRRRRVAVECFVLLATEQVEHRALDAAPRLERGDCAGVDVDAARALVFEFAIGEAR
jgi:hypothetical protein